MLLTIGPRARPRPSGYFPRLECAQPGPCLHPKGGLEQQHCRLISKLHMLGAGPSPPGAKYCPGLLKYPSRGRVARRGAGIQPGPCPRQRQRAIPGPRQVRGLASQKGPSAGGSSGLRGHHGGDSWLPARLAPADEGEVRSLMSASPLWNTHSSREHPSDTAHPHCLWQPGTVWYACPRVSVAEFHRPETLRRKL